MPPHRERVIEHRRPTSITTTLIRCQLGGQQRTRCPQHDLRAESVESHQCHRPQLGQLGMYIYVIGIIQRAQLPWEQQ